MNYNDEIKSGTSVAGFDIGKNINSYLPHLYLQEVEVDRVIFSKGKSNEIHRYIIDKNIKTTPLKKERFSIFLALTPIMASTKIFFI